MNNERKKIEFDFDEVLMQSRINKIDDMSLEELEKSIADSKSICDDYQERKI